MSIHAAVAALDKEIEASEKKRSRLVSLRDALVVEGNTEIEASNRVIAKKGRPGPKPGAKKREPKPSKNKPGQSWGLRKRP